MEDPHTTLNKQNQRMRIPVSPVLLPKVYSKPDLITVPFPDEFCGNDRLFSGRGGPRAIRPQRCGIGTARIMTDDQRPLQGSRYASLSACLGTFTPRRLSCVRSVNVRMSLIRWFSVRHPWTDQGSQAPFHFLHHDFIVRQQLSLESWKLFASQRRDNNSKRCLPVTERRPYPRYKTFTAIKVISSGYR
jgi:hypothetical protein